MKGDRFTELLNLYLDDNATREEQEELMQLISDGGYDETLKDSIKAMQLNGRIQEDMDPESVRKMLKGILATSNERKEIVSIRPAARNGEWLVAAAVLLIAVFAGWWVFKTEPVPRQAITLQEERPESTVLTGKQYAHLPDGSTVLLNQGSKLSYSTSFGEHSRTVNLIGEAYFDVQHDSSKPDRKSVV